jgi:epoxyqueuosine reductase QueG
VGPREVSDAIEGAVLKAAEECSGGCLTRWRAPLVGFAAAEDPRFARLRDVVDRRHALPGDLLEGARGVVSFFLPFDESVVMANARDRSAVAESWAVAYVETNRLLQAIAEAVAARLTAIDIRTAWEPATGRFDRGALTSTWSHKSVAAIAGLGTLGVHHMLITEAGCAGRVGSVVIDAEVAASSGPARERCVHLASGGCLECVERCPVSALGADGSLDKRLCWDRCRAVGARFSELGGPEVCGKCAVGRCALRGNA